MFNLWRYIMAEPSCGKEISEWFEVVMKTQYPFFIFNGRLFGVSHDRQTYLQLDLSLSSGIFSELLPKD